MSMEAVFESIRAMLTEGNARLDCPNAAADERGVQGAAAERGGAEDAGNPRPNKRTRVEKKFDSAESHCSHCMQGYTEAEATHARHHIEQFHNQKGWSNQTSKKG